MESIKVTCTYGDMDLKEMLNDLACTKFLCEATGRFTGNHAPYGYIISNKTLVVDQDAAEIVRKIFRMKIAGRSNQNLADFLNEDRVRSPLEHRLEKGISANGEHLKNGEAAEWSAKSIGRILENPIYADYSQHEAIISETEYSIVQDLLARENRSKVSHLFSGFAFCGSCGSLLYHRKDSARPATYWLCKNKQCSCRQSIREDVLAAAISHELTSQFNLLSDNQQDFLNAGLSRECIAIFFQKISVYDKSKVDLQFRFRNPADFSFQ